MSTVLVILLAVVPLVVARLLLGPVSGSPAHWLRRHLHRPAATAVVHRHRSVGSGNHVTGRRPLEVVAADLRRLEREFSLVGSGAPLVRRRALGAAYDQVLMEAAEQLEVPHTLPLTADGIPRDIERLRIASALEARGLVVRG